MALNQSIDWTEQPAHGSIILPSATVIDESMIGVLKMIKIFLIKSRLTAAYCPVIWCVSFIHREGRFPRLRLSKVLKSSREAGLCPAGKRRVFNRLQSSEGDRKQTLCAAKWDIFLTAVSAALREMNRGRSTPTRQLYSFGRG